MSSYHEAVKKILSELNKFLSLTLKTECLSISATKEKDKLLELLQKLYADYDSLAPSGAEDDSSAASSKDQDDSSVTGGGGHGIEDDYADNIPPSTVKALTDSIKTAYLDRKQKGLFTKWMKCYCVVHKNVFYCFKNPADKKQQFAFYITGYEVRESPQQTKKDMIFDMVCPGKKTYQFRADSKEDLQSWKEAVQKANVLDMVVANPPEEGDVYEEFTENQNQSVSEPFPPPPPPIDETEELYEDGLTPAITSAPPSTITATTTDSVASATSSGTATDAGSGSGGSSGDGHSLSVGSLFSRIKGVITGKSEQSQPEQQQPQPQKEEVSPVVDEYDDDDSMIYEPVDPIPERIKRETPAPPPVAAHTPQVPQDADLPPPPLPVREIGVEQPVPPLPSRNLPLPPPPSQPLPPIPPVQKNLRSPALELKNHPSEDFENMFYGLWSCSADTDNELSFEKGQVIHVISRDLGSVDSWWVGELDGKIGLVPKCFLTPAFQLVH